MATNDTKRGGHPGPLEDSQQNGTVLTMKGISSNPSVIARSGIILDPSMFPMNVGKTSSTIDQVGGPNSLPANGNNIMSGVPSSLLPQANLAMFLKQASQQIGHGAGIVEDSSHDIHLDTSGITNTGSPMPNSAPVNGMMMNLDISSSQFHRALNFDSLSNGAPRETGIQENQFIPMQQENGVMDEENSLMDQSLDANAELFEQQRAREQVALLTRFRQLREWQESQQQLLLQQQQSQMTALRDEQERVHKLIAKQREAQWGGIGSQKQDEEVSSVKKKPPSGRPRSSLPQAIAQGALAMSRRQQGLETAIETQESFDDMELDMGMEEYPRPSTPVNLVKGRPVPMLPTPQETPIEYREYGNPNLDSDSNTIDTKSLEDGVYPLADTASECSEQPDLKHNEPTIHSGANLLKTRSPPPRMANLDSVDFSDVENDKENEPSRLQQQPMQQSIQQPVQQHHHFQKSGTSLPSFLASGQMPNLAALGLSVQQQQLLLQQLQGQMYVQKQPLLQQPQAPANYSAAHHPVPPHPSMPDSSMPHPTLPHSSEITGAISPVVSHPPAHLGQAYFAAHNVHRQTVHPPENRDSNSGKSMHSLQNETERNVGGLSSSYNSREIQQLERSSAGETTGPCDVTGRKVSEYTVLDFREPIREQEDEHEEESDESQYSEEEEGYYQDEEEEDENAAHPQEFDEQPVQGNAGKTFEQLLEEELKREEQKGNPVSAVETGMPQSTGNKVFLRRGEGIARFRSRPAPRKPVTKTKTPSNSEKSKSKETSGGRLTKKETPHSSGMSSEPKSQLTAKDTMKPPAHKQEKPAKSNKASAPLKLLKSKVLGSKKSKTDNKTPRVEKKAPVSASLGETSFQNKIHQLENQVEVEKNELDEFEILEQFADDNASFLSNVSAVDRALNDKKKQCFQASVRKAPEPCEELDTDCEDIPNNLYSNQPQTTTNVMGDDLDDTLTGSPSKSEHVDSQVSSASKRDPMNMESFGAVHMNQKQHSLGNDHRNIDGHPDNTLNGDVVSLKYGKDFSPKRKLAALNRRSAEKLDYYDEEDIASSAKESEDEDDDYTDFGVDSGISSLQKYLQPSGMSHGMNRVNPITKDQPQYSMAPHDVPTVLPPADGYGDADVWDESSVGEEEGSGDAKVSVAPITKTKVYLTSADKSEGEDEDAQPPTSRLVTKLFPKLQQDRPKPKVVEQQAKQEQQLAAVNRVELGDGAQSKALREKLTELESEIERFRNENISLEKLHKEREENLSHLKKEMTEFDNQKQEELKRIQDYKNEEMKKLKKEKRVFEQHQQALRDRPDKKQREEIDGLKTQVSELQDEMKRKEQRWTASSSRLRNRVEQLEEENKELREEIRTVERRRLEAWDQKDSSGVAVKAKKADPLIPQGTSVPRQALAEPQLSQHNPAIQDSALRLSNTYTDGDADSVSDMMESASQIAPYGGADNNEVRGNRRHSSSPRSPRSNKLGPPRQSQKKTASPLSSKIVGSPVDKGDEQFEEVHHSDGKIERIYTNGAREILFSNGTRKQVSADGQRIIVSFFNGDIKQILPDQRVVYYYAEAQTSHTTYPDGLQILQFTNNQVEKHYPDGTREITYPDQTIKYLFTNGKEENIYPDGTVIRVEQNGNRTLEFPNGQREVHTQQYKKREYPDGTVKTVYPDGRQETRYSSGRIRVKDKEGNIIVDRRV